jgi:hypothetical protein
VRSHRPALLIAVLCLTAVAPAHAKVRSLPTILGSKLGKLTASTPLPVLLPQSLPFDYGGKVYGTVSGGSKGYSASFDAAKNCGGANACFLASMLGQKGGKASGKSKVTLRGGITGYFSPLSCGGSCSPPSLEFNKGGVLYDLQARVAQKGKNDKQILVAAVNSALAHGPR